MRMGVPHALSWPSRSTAHSRAYAWRPTRHWSALPRSFGTAVDPTGRVVVPRLWYIRKQGAMRGPFPSGAIIQDRLVGRLSAQDELSPDREEWRVFDDWPEL